MNDLDAINIIKDIQSRFVGTLQDHKTVILAINHIEQRLQPVKVENKSENKKIQENKNE